ncbi:MAG: EpsG family protein, partial [Muribaculaceae bacterium]|nr:EpsG family protein [Muribaculaceae bacterium]
MLIFSIIIGFRSLSVGADTFAFANLYEHLQHHKYSGYPEPIYAFLNIFAGQIGLTYQGFLYLVALLYCLFLTKAITMASPRPGYTIFCLYGLYMMFYAMNISRQMLAVSVVFLAYIYLSRKQTWKFVITVLIASQIHSSAIIALAAYFIPKIQLTKKRVTTYILITFALGFLLSDGMFMSIVDKIGGDYADYLHDTSTRNGFRSGERILLGVLLALFWNSLFIIIFNCIKRKWKDSLWLKIYFVAILLINLTMRMELGIRIVLYFRIIEPIIFTIFM